MSRTITAMFDSRSEAERAREQLRSATGADAKIVDKSSERSSDSGESRGFWADLKEVFMPSEDRESYEEGVRRGGFLLCANVDEKRADEACRILESSGSVDFDSREKEFRSQGFIGGRQPGKIVDEKRIPVVEEQLRVGKREVNRGGARVRSYVEEKPVHESVNLRQEHVNVERRPVDQRIPESELEKGGLLRERNVEMRETSEEPVIGKEARVKEEVVLQKTAEQRKQDVDDKIRRTDVEVEGAHGTGERTSERDPEGTGRR